MAWPSLQKFLSGGVIIEVSRIPKQKDGKPQIQELEPPAVTFCARNTTYWKNATLVVKNDMVRSNCEKETNKEVNDCIKERTFSINDTIKTAFHDITNLTSVMNPLYWKLNFGSPYLGMCHTFIYTTKLKADMLSDGVVFQLDPDLSYKVIIHDPKYFLMASNPLVFPRIWREYKAQDLEPNKFDWLYISLTEHRLLNRPDQPCEEDIPDYDFFACVKTSQAREVGCRPGWESWSDTTLPICTTMAELSLHEKMDWAVFNAEQKIVENRTGCKVPCRYKEFNIVGEPQSGSANILGPIAQN